MIKLPTLDTQWKKPRPRVVRPAFKPLPFPFGPEHDYAAQLIFTAKQSVSAVRTEVVPNLSKLLTYAGRRLPRADDIAERLQELIAWMRSTFGVSTREARPLAVQMLEAVSIGQAEAFAGEYSVLGINPMVGNEKWLPDAMRLATEQNVALIKSIPDDLFDDVERIVGDAVMKGMRVENLAVLLFERFAITEKRATLIARDQTAKWFGSLNRYRQLDAGVVEYAWLTMGDERVRATHRARDGKIYRWDAGGITPGSEVMCRCQPIPQIPDWEEP